MPKYMKNLLGLLLLALAIVPHAGAQTYSDEYVALYEPTMAGTTEAFTLTLPASGTMPQGQVVQVAIQVDQPYTVYVERDGSFPTAPSAIVTPTKVNPGTGASRFVAYSGSNSTGGVKITQTLSLKAGDYVPFGFNGLYLDTGSATRVTAKVTSTVGAKVSFLIYYRERRL